MELLQGERFAPLGSVVLSQLEDHQLSQCVQWRRSIDYMLQAGVEDFYEIGPGKVLSGLVKRIEPQASVVNVGEFEEVQALTG